MQKNFTQKIVDGGKIAGAISAIVALAIMVWGFTVGPVRELWQKFDGVISATATLQVSQQQMQLSLQETLSDISQILIAQSRNVQRIEVLEAKKAHDASPAIRFTPRGHKIEDGAPGSVVEITWQFFKMRDCGRPDVDLMFRNGGGRLHRFENVSVLDSAGLGVATPPDPTMAQTLSYTARIPGNEGVHAGQAFVWVRVSYPDCPMVPAETSPEVPFRILL